MGALAYLWRRHRIALSAFVLAAAAALFFALRFTIFWIYWSDPTHRDMAIEGWMTPGYVAHSYHVPPQVVRDALGVSPTPDRRRRTIEDIARDTGRTKAELIAALRAAIAADRARR